MGIRLDQNLSTLVPELAVPVSGGAAPRSFVSLPSPVVPNVSAAPVSLPTAELDLSSGVTLEQLKDALGEINQALRGLQTDVSIEFDADTGRAQAIVTSADGEVLRVLPPDEVLEALGKVHAIIGLLLDETG